MTAVAKREEHFANTKPRTADSDGATEVLDGVTFTHHFTSTPGDYEKIEWHYVTAGQPTKTPIVFLHGIPGESVGWKSYPFLRQTLVEFETHANRSTLQYWQIAGTSGTIKCPRSPAPTTVLV